ncbi:MAG: 6-phosphofructokinase [Bradymonadia bacterium]
MIPRRIGISTGGGDCPGLNAVIRAFVKTARRRYGIEVVGIEDGLLGLIDPSLQNITLDFAHVRGILSQGGTILGTTNRGNPFKFAVKDEATGEMVERDISDDIVLGAQRLGLDGVVMVGGDGTLEIGRRLMEKGLNVIGVPKTIDNDLSATDVTFGFDTAVGIAMEGLDRLATTAASHDRVMLLEVMGRHAGWIALHAGLAGGADFIAIPEIPYSVDAFLEAINNRQSSGSHFALGVVAEGAIPLDGETSYIEAAKAGGVARLGGAAHRLMEAMVARGCELDGRVTVLGHLQRGGSPSAFDRILGTRFGAAAADLVAKDAWGQMVCLKGQSITSAPLEAALQPNRVDPEGELVQQAESIGVCMGRPLTEAVLKG